MQASNDQIAFVTGANKGLGFEIARQLAERGCRILIGARDRDRGQAAVDLTDLATIATAASDIEAHEGRLDILINNAGITSPGDGSPGVASLDAVRRTFDTNFFGTLALTQAMLPLLKRSSSARIVNQSSGLGSLTQIGDPSTEFSAYRFIGYGASKAALNMLTVQLAAELKDFGISETRPIQGTRLRTSTRIEVGRPYQREQRPPSAWRLCPTMVPREAFLARAIRCPGSAARQMVWVGLAPTGAA